MGFAYRGIYEWQEPKYLFSQFEKSHYVYYPPDWVSNMVIIVEGPLDALWLHQWGHEGCSILGSSLSETQKKYLESTWEEFILVFDNDKAGKKGEERAVQMLRGNDLYIAEYDYGDPQEIPQEKLRGVIEDSSFWLEERKKSLNQRWA